jgi:lipopolysaccharide transport system ATP-binding protein
MVLSFSEITLDCDVLILDEVLAVGDIFFQQKCYARLEELIKRQVTIILVTHQLDSVQQYCKEAILLHQGQKLFQGEPRAAIIQFHKLRRGTLNPVAPASALMKPVTTTIEASNAFFWATDDNFVAVDSPDAKEAQLVRYAICNQDGQFSTIFQQGEQAYLCCEFLLKETIEVPIVSLMITNKFNVVVHAKGSHQQGAIVPPSVNQGNLIRFCRRIDLNIAPGQYVLGFALVTLHSSTYARLGELPQAEVNQQLQIGDVFEKVGTFYVKPHYSYNEHSHFGICNLPGECQMQVVSALEVEGKDPVEEQHNGS